MLRYRIVKHMIMDMLPELLPGMRIPSRNLLCKKFEVSRMTLDKAIRELEEEGYLFSVMGSGTFVSDSVAQRAGGEESWCVIVPDVGDIMYASLIKGIESYTSQKGINIILCNSFDIAERQKTYIDRMAKFGVSGYIIVPVIKDQIIDSYKLYASLVDMDVPFVFCNREVDGIDAPVVKSSDFYGGYIATRHLIEKGYRNIAFIATTRFRTSFDRCQGYLNALMESDIEISRKSIYIPARNEKALTTAQAMDMLLDEVKDMSAVYCFNDQIVKDVYAVLKNRGIRVSDDIGVIGYIDTPYCEQCTPKLTSVQYRNVEIGEKAAEVLYKSIHHQPLSNYNNYIYKPRLVVRESCLGKR